MRHGEIGARAPHTPLSSRSGGFQRAIDRVNRSASSLERRGLLLFVALSSLYWPITALLASRKLMWNDELYTYYVAILPSMRDVWAALESGGEQTPPFFYLTTRASFDIFGVNNLAIRLPAMLGLWVMSACLLVFVARRTSWLPALCAAVFPLVTWAYQYAFEARAYGMVLGFAAVALLSWQSVALGRGRVLWLLSLALSLSAAVSTHYYALFVILPLALGEATRTFINRRIDVGVWAAFAFPAIPLVMHLPLIRAGQAYSGAFWAAPQWVNVPDFYSHLLAPALVGIAAVLVAGIVHAVLVSGERGRVPEPSDPALPVAEVMAALGLIVLPLVIVIVAKVATGAFTNRYALSAVLGFAVLAGFGVAAAFRRHPLMRGAAAAALVGWFALSQARELIEPTGFSVPVSQLSIEWPSRSLTTVARELPFVVADPHTFTQLSHYGSPELTARIAYLADPALALKHLGHNSVERGMLDLVKPWFRMNVVEFEPFVAEHSRFLIYGDFVELEFLNWIVTELQARGLRFELLNRQGDHLFLLASKSEG